MCVYLVVKRRDALDLSFQMHMSYLELVWRGRRSSPAPSVRGCRTLQLSMPISAGSPPLYAEGEKKRRLAKMVSPEVCAKFISLRPR